MADPHFVVNGICQLGTDNAFINSICDLHQSCLDCVYNQCYTCEHKQLRDNDEVCITCGGDYANYIPESTLKEEGLDSSLDLTVKDIIKETNDQ